MSAHLFIETLKNTQGTISKKQLLKQAPEIIIPILIYTYDPFKNYYIRNLNVHGQGNKFIDSSTFELLDDLNDRKILAKIIGESKDDIFMRHVSPLLHLLFNILSTTLLVSRR